MSDEKAPEPGRRKFFSVLSSAAAGAGLIAATQSKIGTIAGASFDYVLDQAWGFVNPKPVDIRMAKSLFFGDSYSGLNVIPSYRLKNGSPTTDTTAAEVVTTVPTQYVLRTTEEILRRTGSRILRVDEIQDCNLAKNVLLLGGPVANETVRSLMGVNGRSERFVNGDSGEALKFQYFFNSSDKTMGDYKTEGSGGIRSPDWTLFGDGGALAPISLVDGRPSEDHVLITSIPNIFNGSALARGDRIVVFAGRHGVGTRSMVLFLGRPDITGPLIELTKSKKGWQAIVRIDQVGADGVTPLSIGNFRVKELDLDFSKVRERQNVVGPL